LNGVAFSIASLLFCCLWARAGGYYDDLEAGSIRFNAQLCVWHASTFGSTLSLRYVQAWCWNAGTMVYCAAIGNLNADGSGEIVTCGRYFEGGFYYPAQLCVWDVGGSIL
jgi:hypothetical protein